MKKVVRVYQGKYLLAFGSLFLGLIALGLNTVLDSDELLFLSLLVGIFFIGYSFFRLYTYWKYKLILSEHYIVEYSWNDKNKLKVRDKRLSELNCEIIKGLGAPVIIPILKFRQGEEEYVFRLSDEAAMGEIIEWAKKSNPEVKFSSNVTKVLNWTQHNKHYWQGH